MQLSPDCLRDILISVEDHTSYNVGTHYPSDEMNSLRDKYSDMQIRYHIVQAAKANLIEPIIEDEDMSRIYIKDLTPKGHEFLANIRSDTVWNDTKKILAKVGTTSATAIVQIAQQIMIALIKNQMGL